MIYLWEDQIANIWRAVQRIESKLGVLMSQDQTIAAEAAAEETSIDAATTALGSIQSLLTALEGEQGLSADTLAAAAKVQSDLSTLATTAQTDLSTDQAATGAASAQTGTPAPPAAS